MIVHRIQMLLLAHIWLFVDIELSPSFLLVHVIPKKCLSYVCPEISNTELKYRFFDHILPGVTATVQIFAHLFVFGYFYLVQCIFCISLFTGSVELRNECFIYL